MNFIIVLLIGYAVLWVSASFLNRMFETPAKRKRKYIRTQKQIHDKINKA